MRLVLRWQTPDEAMGMLVLRFPAVAWLEFKSDQTAALTDRGLLAVSCLLLSPPSTSPTTAAR
jgi:hypothetical protein